MNILVLIRELDKTPLEREIRNAYEHGEVISFCNNGNDEYSLIIDGAEYFNIVQVCIILKEGSYYLYIQHGDNSKLIKLNIDSIEEISCFSSI